MSPERVLVLSCGALAEELLEVVRRNRLSHITVEFLPANLHNTPALIPPAVAHRLARGGYDYALVGYGDCGTAGALDAVLEEFDAERFPGAHCYEFLATGNVFASLHEDDPHTFYITDFLVRHFDRLVWAGLGLDEHPELLDTYFGNYRRLMYFSQFVSPNLVADARRCANRLGLTFEHRHGGLGDIETALIRLARLPRVAAST